MNESRTMLRLATETATDMGIAARATAPRLAALVLALAAAACTTAPRPPETAPPPAPAAPPLATRGEFTIEAGQLDTWNAIGQIVVRTPGVVYEGRAQMLGLYTVRYRGEAFLVLARALLLSEVPRETTRVTAASPTGQPIDSAAAAELLALLQRELPAEIARVREAQAAERKAGARKSRKN